MPTRPLKTHCIAGHEYVEGSFRMGNRNERVCSECSRRRHRESRQRVRRRARAEEERDLNDPFKISISKEAPDGQA